ncbi:unnamed protein product [Calypogeia fissa]
MNQYHIYEAIGRGKHSTVYKGRKKKSVEYYAIKSVEKAQKTRVLQEVRTLHSLDHNNVLKFYAWYETSAHLWLVLEYCVGGDLLTLLRQDARLPEESIHDFARDLVQALQFLHSKGVIYCDLKPSNVLLDENGRLKLCDFGLARRLGDIAKSSVQQLPQAKRGTPCYMAPELFQEGGVHSFGSDLWALGCVMYECFAGRPPFVSNSFTQLVNSILNDSPPPLRGNPTRDFENLVRRLLVKDPSKRIQWAELRDHAFWRHKFQVVPLPPQPALANFLRVTQKTGSPIRESNASRNGTHKTGPSPDKRMVQERNSKLSDSPGAKKSHNHAGNHSDAHLRDAGPVENIPMSLNDVGKKANGSTTGASPLTEGAGRTNGAVNVLRLSKIVKTNLLKEVQGEAYRQPGQSAPLTNDSDVTIENHDQELDFADGTESDGADEEDSVAPSVRSVSEETNSDPEAGSVHPLSEKPENVSSQPVEPSTPSVVSNGKDYEPPQKGKLEAIKAESLRLEVTATPPGVGLPRKLQRQTSNVGESKKNPAGPGHGSGGTEPVKVTLTLAQALWHPSDLSVRPIMINRRPEKASDMSVDARALPVEALQSSDFVKLPSDELDLFLKRIMANVQGSTSIQEKLNTLRYIESLCNNIDAANLLINGPLMPLLVKMLKTSKLPGLRVQLASVMGLLVRHATLIEDELASSGIIAVLTETLRDKQEKLRRCAMATLGELLFYIATQTDGSPKTAASNEHVSKDGRSSVWQVPGTTIALVASILRKGEDDVTQHYALKTIENISSQGGDWASRFTSPEVLDNLCHTFKSAAKPESIRATAGSCLVRLVRFSPAVIPSVLDKLTFKDLVAGLARGSAREQQVSLNLLNMALVGSSVINNMGKYILSLLEERTLVPNLIALLEQGLEVLRGKAFVCAGLLCKINRRWLPALCNAKLMPIVERAAKEKDSFTQQCVEALLQMIVSVVPGILESISSDIAQLATVKRPGNVFSGRGQPRSSIPLFPVVLHLFNSPTFRSRLISEQVMKQLVGSLKQVEKLSFQGQTEFLSTLLQIIEVLSQQSTVVLGYPDIFIAQMLPSLALLYKTNSDGDTRFLCFKIFFDILVLYLDSISAPIPELPATQPVNTDLRPTCMTQMEPIVGQHFLPLYPKLVDDDDPIPMYAHKLLVMLLDHKCIKIADILQLKLISQFFDFLTDDLSSINLHNVRLCLFLASAPEVDTNALSHLKVVRRIGALLDFVHAKGMEDFLDPVLSVCRFFLLRNAGNINMAGTGGTKGSSEDAAIEDIAELGKHAGIFLELCGSHEPQIAEAAAECLVLMVKAAPRSAAIGFFASISKLANVLESCANCHGPVVLQQLQRRLLFALSVVCKEQRVSSPTLQPLPPPVISNSDFIALENIVIRLRKSNFPQVAEVAISAAFELQRLPRQ